MKKVIHIGWNISIWLGCCSYIEAIQQALLWDLIKNTRTSQCFRYYAVEYGLGGIQLKFHIPTSPASRRFRAVWAERAFSSFSLSKSFSKSQEEEERKEVDADIPVDFEAPDLVNSDVDSKSEGEEEQPTPILRRTRPSSPPLRRSSRIRRTT